MKYRLLSMGTALMILLSPALWGQTALERMLQRDEAPPGVVFEIVTGSQSGLSSRLPRARSMIEQLRERFPGLPVAVVTHGREMFALQEDIAPQYRSIHDSARALVAEGDTTLHVCGTYAANRDVPPEAFPDYVDVAAEGPAQIRDYQALGWQLIVLE